VQKFVQRCAVFVSLQVEADTVLCVTTVQMSTAWPRNGIYWSSFPELRSMLVSATCKQVICEEPNRCCCIVLSSVKLSECAKGFMWLSFFLLF